MIPHSIPMEYSIFVAIWGVFTFNTDILKQKIELINKTKKNPFLKNLKSLLLEQILNNILITVTTSCCI